MTRDELLIIKGRVLQKMDDFENLLNVISDRYTPNEEERERLFWSFDDLLHAIDEKISESERETEEKPETEPENEEQFAECDFVIIADHKPAILGYANSAEEAFYFKNLLAENYPDKVLKVFQRCRDDYGSWFYAEALEGGNQNETD